MFDVGAEKLLAEALAFPIPERAKLLARIAESFVPEEAESGPTLIARGQIRWFACLADERRPSSGTELVTSGRARLLLVGVSPPQA